MSFYKIYEYILALTMEEIKQIISDRADYNVLLIFF